MSASHSIPMGAGGFEPDFDEASELARLILSTLDEKGPMPFANIFLEVQMRRSIEPGSLHDLLNNLIAGGLVTLAPTGFYLAA